MSRDPLFHGLTSRPPRRGHPARHKNPHGSQRRRLAPTGGCYVYLLVHAAEQRFKIGLSQNPTARACQLPEAQDLALERSLQVLLPGFQRAIEVERMLHKALAGFRMRLEGPAGQSWDGSTEWFSLPGLRHAINLLRVTPVDDDPSKLAQLQTLEGAPYQNPLVPESQTPAQVRREQAVEYNLQRLSEISGVLATLRQHLKIELRTVTDATGRTDRLCIHDLRNAWEPKLLKARFEVVASALWELRTGHLNAKRQRVPLVRLIRYSDDTPGMLELVVNDLSLIRRLPAGERVVAMWRAMCKGF